METLQWIIGQVSYLSVFIILFWSGLGFPVPEEITLMAAGASAAMGTTALVPMIAVCYLAIIGGDTVAFAVGRYLGERITRSRFARFVMLTPIRVRKARYLFFKRGTWAVVIARFLPGLRVAAFFVAGTMRVSWMRFVLADSAALVASAPVGLGLGWFLGSSLLTDDGWARAQHILHRWHTVLMVVIGTLVVVAVVAYLLRRRTLAARRARLRGTRES